MLLAEFGPGAAARKLGILKAFEERKLGSARAVRDLHEALCFLRAYPDDAALLAQVERMLASFDRREDLRQAASKLADSGIAGTETRYRFYAETAFWLARRYPALLRVDWDEVTSKQEELLLERLSILAHYAETPGLDEADLSLRAWIDRMKARSDGDGAFLAGRFEALDADPRVREAIWDEVDLPLRLLWAPGAPSRTHAKVDAKVHWQRGPLRRERPDLRVALRAKPRVRIVTEREGNDLIRLAREAMVTRQRDLDVFAYGDPRDVRLLDCGDGLVFAAIGFKPARRLLLEAVYGFLTLKNGVPIGYVLNSALFGSAEIAYNVFETYRGAEAGHVYGWVLACVRHLFGADAFTIYPYQLGQDNDEALDSGAWWFYQKLGFRPRDKGALALMRKELAAMERRPGRRSTRATLARLADHNLYYFMGKPRHDVIGEVSLQSIGLAATDFLAKRGRADLGREAATRLGATLAGWTRDERLAWSRWAPLLLAADGVERWTPAERRAAVAAVRAKGGRRESDFVRLFDGHGKLRAAILRMGRSVAG
ncbi:MAG TPA: hypothetical protein VFY93_03105 [Planctomycetota bacterium]|nr:hypothetical protein [Planctomycetota bacterium]